jgi:cytochrome c oxidase assembly protein subunit 15
VALLFIVVCLQGALGALTVTLLLKPLIVTGHLIGGLTTLALLWWIALTPPRRDLSPPELGLRKFAVVACAILSLQIFLGGWTSTNYAAVACPDFPTCQRSWWPTMDFHDAFVLWRGLGINYEGGVLANPARMAIHLTHRFGALVTGSVLLTLGVLTLLRAKSRRLFSGGDCGHGGRSPADFNRYCDRALRGASAARDPAQRRRRYSGGQHGVVAQGSLAGLIHRHGTLAP